METRLVLTLYFSSSLVMVFIFGAEVHDVYERVGFYDNVNTIEMPILTTSVKPRDRFLCPLLCLRHKSCSHFRLYNGHCSLLRSSPGKAGNLLGTVFFSHNKDICPMSEGYMLLTNPRLSYKIVRKKLKWYDAQARCQREGARLIILNTDDTHAFINKLSIEMNTSFFVGLKKIHKDQFAWTDGTTYVSQWQPGEPDFLDHQNCGGMHAEGIMDIECFNGRYYICEIDMTL